MTSMIIQRKKENQKALENLRSNSRVLKIRIASPEDCASGTSIQGVYAKDQVPELPYKGCSRKGGCICRYEPILGEIFP